MGGELFLTGACAGLAGWLAIAPGTAEAGALRAARRQAELLRLLTAIGGAVPSGLSRWRAWASVSAAIRREARARGIVLTTTHAEGLLAFLCAACGLVGSALMASPAGLVLAPLALCGVGPMAAALERRREQAVSQALPDAYRSLASALGSGKTLAQAVEYVGRHAPGEVGEAFEAVALELSCGSSVDEGLEVLARRLPERTLGLLACALAVSQRTGAPLAGLLERAAGLMEEREGLGRLLRTKTAQVRLSARVVMALPACLVGALALLSPDFRAGVATPVGAGSLVLAAVLDGAALVAMRSVLKGVEP